MPTKLGIKINKLRTERGLSLEGLATAADVSKSYLWEVENREVSPTAEKVKAIAKALQVEIAFLFDDQLQAEPQDQRDRRFFRKYTQLDPEGKEQMERILDTFRTPPRK
jgi:transcriptional regulator with XRE-family HTH domain